MELTGKVKSHNRIKKLHSTNSSQITRHACINCLNTVVFLSHLSSTVYTEVLLITLTGFCTTFLTEFWVTLIFPILCSIKKKFSHTRYRVLGSELIQMYRQSVRRLSLLAVTFPAEQRHCPSASTKLYCLVTEAHGCYSTARRPGFELTTTESPVRSMSIASPSAAYQINKSNLITNLWHHYNV